MVGLRDKILTMDCEVNTKSFHKRKDILNNLSSQWTDTWSNWLYGVTAAIFTDTNYNHSDNRGVLLLLHAHTHSGDCCELIVLYWTRQSAAQMSCAPVVLCEARKCDGGQVCCADCCFSDIVDPRSGDHHVCLLTFDPSYKTRPGFQRVSEVKSAQTNNPTKHTVTQQIFELRLYQPGRRALWACLPHFDTKSPASSHLPAP